MTSKDFFRLWGLYVTFRWDKYYEELTSLTGKLEVKHG